jgi:hypothetical protein
MTKAKTYPAYADEFIGPREPMILGLIPFHGFYESTLSEMIDGEQEQEAEYRSPETGVSESDYNEILAECTDYRQVHEAIAQKWMDAFDEHCADQTGIELGLRFESLNSPREYNFCTDRIFVHVPVRVVRALIKATEGGVELRVVARERHSCRDGFISFIPSDISGNHWRGMLTKPETMRANEFETVLLAALGWSGDDVDPNGDVYDLFHNGDGIYHQWSESVDWPRVEALVADAQKEAKRGNEHATY